MNTNNNSSLYKASEIHFLSQDEPIRIIPSFSCDVLHFLNGDYGPFETLIPIAVPFWLAIQLKKNKKCKMITPTWMEVGMYDLRVFSVVDHVAASLKELLETEKADERYVSTVVPHHYIEIATQILDVYVFLINLQLTKFNSYLFTQY